MRLYPPHILKIFAQNKLRDGLTEPQIARLLRELLHWPQLEPANMDEYGQERYGAVDAYLRELESTDPVGED